MAQLTSNIDNLQTILNAVNNLPEASTEDASVQIANHNSSTTAHSDIRNLISEYATASAGSSSLPIFFENGKPKVIENLYLGSSQDTNSKMFEIKRKSTDSAAYGKLSLKLSSQGGSGILGFTHYADDGSSDYTTELYLSQESFFPILNNEISLGRSSNKWRNIYGEYFIGCGANLTDLNATNITQGTLSETRLPTSGVTAGSYGPTGSVTSGSFNVPQVTVDAYGRVTKVVNRQITLPTAGSGGTTSSYTLPVASSSELGGVKIGYSTNGKNYAVELDNNNKMYVNVPWTDNNTTYSSGTGVSISNSTISLATVSGLTAASYGPSANASPSHSGTFSVPYFTVDSYGRITSASTKTITLPSSSSYSLPNATTSTKGGVKIGSNITVSSGTISLTKDNVTSALGYTPPTTNTTYSAATTSSSGLMTAAMVTKLNGIAEGANNYTYTLPNATSSTLGGVKVGSNITVSSGTISLTKANVTAALGYTPPTSDTNTTYTAGTGISISASNVISCSVSAYTLPSASTSTLGGVRFGYGSLSSRPSSATAGTIYLATS